MKCIHFVKFILFVVLIILICQELKYMGLMTDGTLVVATKWEKVTPNAQTTTNSAGQVTTTNSAGQVTTINSAGQVVTNNSGDQVGAVDQVGAADQVGVDDSGNQVGAVDQVVTKQTLGPVQRYALNISKAYQPMVKDLIQLRNQQKINTQLENTIDSQRVCSNRPATYLAGLECPEMSELEWNISGDVIGTTSESITDKDACGELCNSDTTCEGYVWKRATNGCTLYKDIVYDKDKPPWACVPKPSKNDGNINPCVFFVNARPPLQ